MDLDEIKRQLRDRAEELAHFLFPLGKQSSKDWTIGDINGTPSRKPTGIGSLGVCVNGIKAGAWRDHAYGTGEGETLLDLWARRYGYHGTDGWVIKAGAEAAAWLGGEFEKRGTNGSKPAPSAQSKASNTKPAPPPPPPPKARKSEPMPELPSYEEEWTKAVEALNDDSMLKLAGDRGLNLGFIQFLKEHRLMGTVATKHGPAFALPVHDPEGKVVAAHVRNRIKDTEKKKIDPPLPAWQYRYNGDKSPGTQPLIIGDVAKVKQIWVFESQWDAFAALDRLSFHKRPLESWPVAIFITRGASNGALIARVAKEGKSFILWPQNDQPDDSGKIASEEWVNRILETLGSLPVRRVNTPAEFEDPNAWLKAQPEATADKILELIAQAQPARATKLPLVRDMAFAIRPENRTPEPPQVIEGLLHRGSKLIVGGTSKGRKSFSLLDLAVAVATGSKWWGFQCVQGRVLYLNFEIQQPFLEGRVSIIAERKGAAMMPGNFLAMTLRGMTETVENIADELIKYILSLEPFALIIFDPIYKLMAGRDENKAGDVTAIMAQLEKIAVQTGAAVAFGAHYSKGNQAGKESIDRIGGSGAFARDPDAIMTMTAHEESEDHFTVQSTLRNFAPIEPFVLAWEYPLFSRDTTGLDPAALKMPKKPGERAQGVKPVTERKNGRLAPSLDMLKACWHDIPRALTYGSFLDRAKLRCVNGAGNPLPEPTAKDYFGCLKSNDYIKKDGRNWITTEKGDAYLDEQNPPEQPEPEQQEPDPLLL
jgi:hypothetical protein